LFEMRPAAAAVWCVCCAGWWLLESGRSSNTTKE
jgi:hypothetical protein